MKRITKLILNRAHRKVRRARSDQTPKVPELLIFDFDGTIADTFQNGVEILNEMSVEFGYRPLLEKDIEAARGMTIRQLMRYLGISLTQLPLISFRGVKLLHSRMQKIKPIPGIPELLHKLQAEGMPMGILTSNSEENVTAFLRRHQLEVFSFIRSSSRLFGKAHELNIILRNQKLNAENVLFIGDEARDIEAAHRTKVPIVAVDWGYNSRKTLEDRHPQATIGHPAELLQFLSLQNSSVVC